MDKLLIILFLQFFHIGVFSFGGGYSTLPFLYELIEKYNWYTSTQLTNMIAVSSITPGPVGVNMATFAGFTTHGLLGAFIATFAIMLPSFIIVSFVYKLLDKFKTNGCVINIIKSLKPAGCALLTAVGLKLIFTTNLNLLGCIILVTLIYLGLKQKKEPLFYMITTGVLGLILGAFNFIGI